MEIGEDADAVLGMLSVGEGRTSGCCCRYWWWRGVWGGVSGGVGGMPATLLLGPVGVCGGDDLTGEPSIDVRRRLRTVS